MDDLQIDDLEAGEDLSELALARQVLALICSNEDGIYHLDGVLKRYGFVIHHTESPSFVNDALYLNKFAIIIIDACFLYDTTATNVKALLLGKSRPGVLILSGSNDDIDRIVAIDMGADDCVDKSCSAREIGARAAAIVRRASIRSEMERESSRFDFAGWEIHANRRQLLTPEKNMIHLTATEYSILSCLLSNPGSVKSRADLRYYPDTGDDNDCDPRAMDVLVSRLRKKLMSYGDEDIIETVRGFGYRLITR